MRYLIAIFLALGLNQAAYAACSGGGTAEFLGGNFGFSAIGWGTAKNATQSGNQIAIAGFWTFSAPSLAPKQKSMTGTVTRIFTFTNVQGTSVLTAGGPGASGTYTINPDCSGTASFTNVPGLGTETYAIYVTSANVIYWINTTPVPAGLTGIVFSGRMDKP